MNRDELIAAHRAGRAAAVGDPNPYAGTGAPARMWRRGYRLMLLDMLNRSPAAQAYENARTD
ncbi:hypothetical protein SEA_PHELPSODU_10 [Mycobacterium phage PhelpsODU]|uniref:Uncharacterized protein n=1 Tax=Mycobacterium phage Unicorn TaxID=2015825 RepID=A0A222ZL59_9CAUD|nr:hypothetical protein I5G78_gp095 [Mycobacterium phage Unicorn]ASR85022.1 hypothetical protein SEA_UNICORN_10 [Mycobacterium phage Unicorn]ASR85122.1 hypothetical protein SEA_PHELPSODU_10 [Mycobacterium phage PhelpsODU]